MPMITPSSVSAHPGGAVPGGLLSVSVLMPTYEQGVFLARALDSLLAQTLADWEAIIEDASPSDATAEAVQPWLRDPRIR